MKIFETDRLLFRLWKEEDIKPFSDLGKNIEGMRFFARSYTEAESFAKMCEHIIFLEDHGYGFWAVELKETGQFIGTIGVNEPSIQAFFTPCIQIGWCLDRCFWGQGFATEGARATLDYLQQNTDLTEIFSYTYINNHASLKVMKKLGMKLITEFTLLDDDDIFIVYHKVLR